MFRKIIKFSSKGHEILIILAFDIDRSQIYMNYIYYLKQPIKISKISLFLYSFIVQDITHIMLKKAEKYVLNMKYILKFF
jgi:hypothetical protein